MPALDMTGVTDEMDYSDFEYQQVLINVTDGSNSGNVNLAFNQAFEVLSGIGGLNNNEVAELVYFDINARIEPEDENKDIDVSTAAELRGFFGANIDVEGGLPAIGDKISIDSEDGANGDGFVSADDRVFKAFSTNAVLPFDDTTGPGGGALDNFYAEMYYRQVVGRGPVLDSSDNLNVSGALIAGDILPASLGAEIRMNLIFDVAETSDAGRAFSVPM